MRKHIAIFGSCISRDPFRTDFNKYWHSRFEIDIDYQRNSLISVLNQKINVNRTLLRIYPYSANNRFRTRNLVKDFKKTFLKELKKQQVEYLIMDMYFETLMGIRMYGDGIITNNFLDLPETRFYKKAIKNNELGEVMSMQTNPVEYFNLWKTACDKFFKYLDTHCPNTKVILNETHLVDKFITNGNTIETFEEDTKIIKQIYPNIKKMENYVKDNYDVYVIKHDSNIYGDEKHIWGKDIVHYQRKYYTDFMKKLNKVIETDQLLKYDSEDATKKVCQVNEILDKNNFEIKIIGDRKYILDKINSQLNQFKQSFLDSSIDYIRFEWLVNDYLRQHERKRFDIKNFGKGNKIELLEISDNSADIAFPPWFSDEKGEGLIIETSAKVLDLKLKMINSGELNIVLKGVDYENGTNQRIPIYVQYNKFSVNGKLIIDSPKFINHDSPHIHYEEVKDGEIIEIHVECEKLI